MVFSTVFHHCQKWTLHFPRLQYQVTLFTACFDALSSIAMWFSFLSLSMLHIMTFPSPPHEPLWSILHCPPMICSVCRDFHLDRKASGLALAFAYREAQIGDVHVFFSFGLGILVWTFFGPIVLGFQNLWPAAMESKCPIFVMYGKDPRWCSLFGYLIKFQTKMARRPRGMSGHLEVLQDWDLHNLQLMLYQHSQPTPYWRWGTFFPCLALVSLVWKHPFLFWYRLRIISFNRGIVMIILQQPIDSRSFELHWLFLCMSDCSNGGSLTCSLPNKVAWYANIRKSEFCDSFKKNAYCSW